MCAGEEGHRYEVSVDYSSSRLNVMQEEEMHVSGSGETARVCVQRARCHRRRAG